VIGLLPHQLAASIVTINSRRSGTGQRSAGHEVAVDHGGSGNTFVPVGVREDEYVELREAVERYRGQVPAEQRAAIDECLRVMLDSREERASQSGKQIKK